MHHVRHQVAAIGIGLAFLCAGCGYHITRYPTAGTARGPVMEVAEYRITSDSRDKPEPYAEAHSKAMASPASKVYGPVLRALAFSPTGGAPALAVDRTLFLWNPANATFVHRFGQHDLGIGAAAFSPDGQYILSGGDNGVIKLWGVSTGREARAMTRHEGPVRAVAFTPDGQRGISAGYDGTVRVWDLKPRSGGGTTPPGEPEHDGSGDLARWPHAGGGNSDAGAEHARRRVAAVGPAHGPNAAKDRRNGPGGQLRGVRGQRSRAVRRVATTIATMGHSFGFA